MSSFLDVYFEDDSNSDSHNNEQYDFFGNMIYHPYEQPSIQPSVQLPTPKTTSKWTELEKIKYLMFPLHLMTERPYMDVSWSFWKTEKIYNKMEAYIQTKTWQQCKSFDQRQKSAHFRQNQRLDLVPYALRELVRKRNDFSLPLQIATEIQRLLSRYYSLSSEKGQHMNLLEVMIASTIEADARLNSLLDGGKQGPMSTRMFIED